MTVRDATIKPVAHTDTAAAPLGGGLSFTRGLWRIAGAAVTSGNAVRLLDSDETFEVALAEIEQAAHSIDLEVYIYRGDEIGRRTTGLLVAAARRGVAVRVLVDALGSFGGGGRHMFGQLRAAGVTVRRFSPLGLRPWLGALPRDHRKVLVVDGHVGITGGVNVGDEWTSFTGRVRRSWRDTTIRIEGPAAHDLTSSFEHMWRRALGEPLTRAERRAARRLVRRPRNAGLDTESAPSLVGIIEGEPGRFRISRALQLQAVAAERSIWIASAYFIPGGAEMEALSGAARDGVDVRVLVPSTYDHPWIRRFARRRYRRLLENGVRIWEWKGEMMHAKTSVVDARLVRVGSTDFNPLGLSINYELDALVFDATVGAAAEAIFLRDLALSKEITWRSAEARETT
jgi:cardiolipin synthase